MPAFKGENSRINTFPSWSWAGWNSEIHYANRYSLLETPRSDNGISIEICNEDPLHPLEDGQDRDGNESISRTIHILSTKISLDCFAANIPEGYKSRDGLVRLESRGGLVDGYLMVNKNITARQNSRASVYMLVHLSTRPIRMENQEYFASVLEKTLWHLGLPDFKKHPERFHNVLLIEENGRYAERIGMGVVHRNAWSAAGPQRADVKLV